MVKRLRSRWFQLFKAFQSFKTISSRHEARGNRQKLIVPDVPDFPHHVVQRGVRRMDVFFSADNRQEYLDLLSQSSSGSLMRIDLLKWNDGQEGFGKYQRI
jgi:hypothetical protein